MACLFYKAILLKKAFHSINLMRGKNVMRAEVIRVKK